MDAVILCGGKGTRLAPALLPGLPKCMARVNGEPFIDIFLRGLRQQRLFSTFVFCTGYGADVVEAHLGNTFWDGEADISTRLYFSREPEQMGAGYAVLNAARAGYITTDPFFVFNGDTFCATDYLALFNAHMDAETAATVALGIGGIASEWARDNAGAFVLGHEALEVMEKMPVPFSLENVLARVDVAAVSMANRYYDIGTPESLRAFQEFHGTLIR